MENVDYKETSTLQLVLAWTFVGVPLLAGVLQTLTNAMQLFRRIWPAPSPPTVQASIH